MKAIEERKNICNPLSDLFGGTCRELGIAYGFNSNLGKLRQGVDSLAKWYSIRVLTRRPGFDSHQSHVMFFSLICFVLCYGFHVVRWGLSPRLGLILR